MKITRFLKTVIEGIPLVFDRINRIFNFENYHRQEIETLLKSSEGSKKYYEAIDYLKINTKVKSVDVSFGETVLTISII